MTRKRDWICAGLLLGAAAQGAETARTLENGHLRITLKASGKAAYIEEFHAKAQGRNLAAADPVPLFQVDLYRDGRPETLDPARADRLDLVRIDSGSVELRAEFKAYGLTVRQRVTLRPDSPMAEMTMGFRLANPAYRVGLARLPGLGLRLDAGPESAVLLPVADGMVVENPGNLIQDGEKRSFNYPGMASAQLMAAYDGKGGLAAFPADSRGDFKMLTVRRHGGRLLLVFECVLYHLDPPEVELPYAVMLGAFRGGWEHAADLYKAWAKRQPWCARTLPARRLPEALGRTAFSLGVNLRVGEGAEGRDRTRDIPALARGWSQGLGMPVNAVLLSWERHGPWIAPDYFPPYGGEDAFRRLVRDLHADGNQASAFLSGFNVTLEKTARHGAPGYRADSAMTRRLEAAAVAGPDGKPFLEGRPGEGTGRRATLCPSTPEARRLVAEAFRKLREYGVDRIQLDQVVGGGVPPCFSTSHGHPPVGGNHMYRAVSGLLDSLAALDGRAVLMLEEPGELYIPHVHVFHTREYMEGHWPRDGAGVKGVPLFTYLYHEYALGYGGDSAPICPQGEDPTLALYAQAVNLINGRTPAAASWMRLVPFDQVDARQRRFLQDAARLWQGPAGDYLRHGAMLPLDHQVFRPWRVRGRAAGARFDFRTRNILASAYRLPDGRSAVGYVNLSGEAIRAELRFASGRARMPGEARVLQAGGGPGAAGKGRLKSGAAFDFPPHGYLFMEAGK